MASSKRKLDEKQHLKILRELVSLPGNKECFDCRQRGPTYVNVTIGSFVCTTCSGMLRGLTPPHRVKSISMATFTPEEIDFIKSHGNDYCRKTWLGLMNISQQNQHIDKKDEQKMKDLMIAKYETKNYYLEPSFDNNNNNSNNNNNNKNQKIQVNKNLKNINNNNIQISIPRVPQIGVMPISITPVNNKINNNYNNNKIKNTVDGFTTDFVADFSKVPDPFVPETISYTNTKIEQQPSFANFDNNPVFNSNNNDMSSSFNQIGKTHMSNLNGINVPPSEDRYAALKDLDSMMKKNQFKDDISTATQPSQLPLSSSTSSTAWINNNSNQVNNLWTTNEQTSNVISNPFVGNNDLWGTSLHTFNSNNNNNNMQSVDNGICNAANPFRQMQLSDNNESQWIGFGSQNTTDAFASSQLPGKIWHPTVSSYQANPFMVGTGVGNPSRSSNNPFL